MARDLTIATKKTIWKNVLFFGGVHLVAFIGVPLYIIYHGFNPADLYLAMFFWLATGLGITVGYHRLFSHRAYNANKIVQFLSLFFGAAAFEMSALRWSVQHRTHHKYVDTPKDPYNIKQGFWYAHVGWMLSYTHDIDYDNAKDLQKSRMMMHQHKYYLVWAIGAGFALPALLGALFGSGWLAGFLIAGFARIVIVYQGTFCINSVCHVFGKSTYDIDGTAKDNWFTALFTYGEGYHNFHHRFASDYRNGVKWYDFDPSKWTISLLSKIGWAWGLNRIPQHRIIDARVAAENLQTVTHLKTFLQWKDKDAALALVKERYEGLLAALQQWEEKVVNYTQTAKQLETPRKQLRLLSKNVKVARKGFKKAHKDWKEFSEKVFELPKLSPSLQGLLA